MTPELRTSLTIISSSSGMVVERPRVVQDRSVLHAVATKVGTGSLAVTTLHTVDRNLEALTTLTAQFLVLPSEAVASATQLQCDHHESHVRIGEHVECRLNFGDQYGNPTYSWPQLGPGLGDVPFTIRPLGVAGHAEALHEGIMPTPERRGVTTGFRADAVGRAGMALVLSEAGGESIVREVWVDVV